MGGRETVPGIQVTRLSCDDPGVTVFGISGSLGPRARPLLERLTQECVRRELRRLVFDLSAVDSLGGGSARLLQEFAAERQRLGWKTAFCVASTTVRRFLTADHEAPRPSWMHETLEHAVAAVGADDAASPETQDGPRTVEQLRTEAHELKRLLHAVGLEGRVRDGRRESFVEDDTWGPEAVPENGTGGGGTGGGGTGRGGTSDVGASDVGASDVGTSEVGTGEGATVDAPIEEVAARLVRALCQAQLASRVHVFALQADGTYYAVSRRGIDFDRGLPYHGVIAGRLRQQDGPCLLDDLCDGPLTESEEAVVVELNCEIVAATGGDEVAEVLVFLSKERPGDEYTLDELQDVERVMTEALHADTPRLEAPDAGDDHAEAADEKSGSVRQAATLVRDTHEEQRQKESVAPPIRKLPGAPVHRENERLLRRKVAQLRDILHLTRGFDAAFGTSRILDVLVLSVVSVARSDTVLYFSERGGEYTLTHHRGLDAQVLPEMRLRSDSTLTQAAQNSGEPVRIEASDRVTDEEKIWARQHGFSWLVPFRSKDRVLGLLLLGGADTVDPDLEMLGHLLHEAAVAYERALLHETLEDRTLGVVRGLITLIESRGGYEQGSTEKVVRYTQALAGEIHFPRHRMRELVYGAVLRDVGMLRIDQSVLHTSGQLSADEWEDVRRHTIEGAAIMRQMRFSELSIEVVLHHHEAYNGEGYPMGLRGRAIPVGARIVSVAESYVKMTMDRPYRKALGRVEALESLAENWGLRYDPLIVDALVRVVNRELSMGLKGDVDFARDLFGV